MTSKRENDFPAISIGRTSGSRLQQAAAAHEAHPLSSPGPASPAPSDSGAISGSGATLSVNGNPKYVPYTPRQRVAPTSATTATAHPPSVQQHQGDATSKLQLMHLKAAAQNIGLDSGSLGWSILEKLVLDCDYSEEWTEIYSAITSSKATLLLPLEPALIHEKITAEFVKDHVVLCEGSSRNNAQIVTLSGLRGTLNDETLTFRSTIHPTSKLFQDLLNPATKSSTFSLLPPLPMSFPDITYPQYIVPSYVASIVLPPRSQSAAKPPLPPRLNNRPTTTASSTAAPSRLTNTFASLFGGSNYVKSSTPPVSASPPASLHSVDSAQDSHAPVEVSAFTIDRRIVREEIGGEMNKILKAELEAALNATASLGSIPMPGWIVERVQDMTATWYPFVKAPSSSSVLKKRPDKETNSIRYLVNPIAENPDEAAERLQDFYLCLEQDMRVGGVPFLSKQSEKYPESDGEDDKEREQREHEMMESETRVREIMEAVERTITSLFYDRLFMQPTTDDASHDEALSSRVAALNLLDLGLGHLGIEVGGVVNEGELDHVVKACGDMLTGLDACQSPGDKAAMLVAAHKLVVDGLSKLPPIRLISENDAKYEEDLDNGPETAKPTIVPAELEVNVTALPSALIQVPPPSEIIPEISSLAVPPPVSSFQLSPEAVLSPPPESNSPSSRIKHLPPPLVLSTTVSSSEASSPEVAATSLPKEPTIVSGDVLLPLIIFSVVKCNPPRLVSNLLFTQRFRNQSVGGEESYCLINLMAVAEFLENVDMAALGLGDSEKVTSTADLTPIPLTRSPLTSETPLVPVDGGLRGRVEQHVDAIADSANKVISGVVDSSFGILRSFMPSSAIPIPTGNKLSPGIETTEHMKPGGFGLLNRRESGFSIASLAASLPIGGAARARSTGEESGQQLITVSRPSSLRSKASWHDGSQDDDEETDDRSENGPTGDEESDSGDEGDSNIPEAVSGAGDARSIRSFENMLSAGKERDGKSRKTVRPRTRKSLSDRLASVSALAASKTSPPGSPRSSLLLRNAQAAAVNPRVGPPSPPLASSSSPLQLRLAPPKKRFIECTPDDLRLSEVGELLREYRRLVEGIRAVGGFDVA
ncbi:hypothetical protein BYT27DRAFT_7149988 [Phlegmacium glaucopus]|nr:hypothetical protein BYT27DRAFT_7149988 [Phlegmacium glaucopus]